MPINPTKGRFTVDRSSKRFTFTNNPYTKKGNFVLLFIVQANCLFAKEALRDWLISDSQVLQVSVFF